MSYTKNVINLINQTNTTGLTTVLVLTHFIREKDCGRGSKAFIIWLARFANLVI